MPKITNKHDLPKWFTKDRYSWLKDASIQHLANQWARRVAAHHDIENGLLDSEHLTSIYQNNGAFEQSKEIQRPPLDSEIAYPLTAGDLLQRTRMINTDIFESEACLSYDLATQGVIVEILLKDFTDSEILSELKAILPKIRHKLDMPEPKLFRMEGQISKLRTGGVFEYMDLFLWAKSNNKTIHNDLYAAVIKPGSYTSDYISNNLRTDSKAMLTLRFTDLLAAECFK